MKFLYASSVSRSRQYSGILKKVVGQTRGVARLGWEAFYTCVESSSVALYSEADLPVQQKPFESGMRWRKQQQAITDRICDLAQKGAYDAVYIKGLLANPYAYRIAAAAKAGNPSCKVIFEVATYPYWSTYRRLLHSAWKQRNLRSFAGYLFEVLQHCTAAPKMKRQVDALAVFGSPVKKLWGIPCAMLENGIEIDETVLAKKKTDPQKIHILGVVGTTISHGYSRFVEGMAQYTGSKKNSIYFDIVGRNETLPALEKRAEELHVAGNVRFLGYKSANELQKIYGSYDAAVSVLGGYRLKLYAMSPLKSREYCAAGIPFVYAYEDTLPADAPFTLKIPNDASPVKIEDVVKFVENCRSDPGLPAKERQFAKDHYDWKIIMKRVLDFAGAANQGN